MLYGNVSGNYDRKGFILMTDFTTYDSTHLRELIRSLIAEKGITASIENLPPLFRVGCGYDTESTTIKERVLDRTTKSGKEIFRTDVKACFNYAYQLSLTPDYYAIYRYKEQFINALQCIVDAVRAYNEHNETNAVFIIWCANLSHEWSFIKADIYNRFEITKAFAKSPRDILYIQLESCVEFRECIGLFGHSLDDISKNWCKTNRKLTGTFDYDLIRHCQTELTETERAYMINDVTSLAEMHENVITYYTQSNGVCRLPYTSSGFVRMDLKNSIRNDDDLTTLREIYNEKHRKKPLDNNIEYLMKENAKTIKDAYQWHICRDYSYAGGLCGSNIKYAGAILKDVVCADITSDYPAQLTQQKYPYGSLKRAEGNLRDIMDFCREKKKPFFAILKIKSMYAKTSHAVFSKHKIINVETDYFAHIGEPTDLTIYNGKVYKGKNLVVCWNDIDLQAYESMYELSYNVLTLWYFDSYKKLPMWFLRPMWNNYEKKALLKARGEKDTIDYNNAKRDVNSVYGVCAQRVTEVFDTLDTNLNFMSSKPTSFKKIKEKQWLNPYIAFWCTSYARALLMRFISQYPDAIVQYDTDSLYYIKSKGADLEQALLAYNAEIEKQNNRIFKDHEHKTVFEDLGTWDFDDVYSRFCGMGAKKYLKEQNGKIHTVIAGLPKKAIPEEISEKAIEQPFTYYNPLVKWIREKDNSIIIKHMFAHKFASVYSDRLDTYYEQITDHNGVTAMQSMGCYHAIVPIDFTLTMAKDFIRQIIQQR